MVPAAAVHASEAEFVARAFTDVHAATLFARAPHASDMGMDAGANI